MKLFHLCFLLYFIPLTHCAVLYYSLNILNVTLALNGVPRTVYTFNGTMPGPPLYANVGDTLVINVTNYLHIGTSVHWHGIFQTGTPEYDGVSYLTQCPIPYGTSLIYNFTVQQWGTYFYHSHTGTQYGDGMRASLVIYNTPEIYASYYDEEIIIHLIDWYNTLESKLLTFYLSPPSKGVEPVPDSTLIDGFGYFDCSKYNGTCYQRPQIAKVYPVKKGTRYRLRIINSSSFAHYHFSIDNHNLTIIEADGVDYNMYTTEALEINVAQRYSVLLYADQPIDNYWIRVGDIPMTYAVPPHSRLSARAVLRYEGAPVARPTTRKNNLGFQNYLHLVPYGSPPAPGPVTTEITLNIVFQDNAAGVNVPTINNASYYPPPTPVIYSAYYNQSFPSSYSRSVYTLANRGDVIQLNINNFDDGEHPLHLHGHVFAVLALAPGVYNPETTVLNTVNPPLRDTATIKPHYHAVWRFVANNPGVWIWHCHIVWHLAAGFAVIFNEIPSEQKASFVLLAQTTVNCTAPSS